MREPKQSAHGGTEGRGGILLQNEEIWEYFGEDYKSGNRPIADRPCERRRKCQNRIQIYSSGRRNSKPNRRHSPKSSSRSTFAIIGGVSLGIMLEAVGMGAGIVS